MRARSRSLREMQRAGLVILGAMGLWACGITLVGGGAPEPEPEPAAKVDAGKARGDAASDAPASPPSTSMGNGQSGDVTISALQIVNRYASLKQPAMAEATKVVINANIEADKTKPTDTSDFDPGRLVLLWKSSSGAAATADAMANGTGTYAVRRILGIEKAGADNVLVLDAAVGLAGTADEIQAVLLPEYKSLQVTTNGTIDAMPFDGRIGGIVAFMVQDTATIEGSVTAHGGGRGGAIKGTNKKNCTNADGKPDDGYGHKGEGVLRTFFGPTNGTALFGGAPAHGNGGGGGGCYAAGGGGGGNGTAGGAGGYTLDAATADLGGRGGDALKGDKAAVFLGGGGGAGSLEDGSGPGGAGGGAIWIRADRVTGKGTYDASGSAGPFTLGAKATGGGGGGAGGTLDIQVKASIDCLQLAAVGGAGAATGSAAAPTLAGGGGGGGGAGRIIVTEAKSRDALCALKAGPGTGGADRMAKDGEALATPTATITELPPLK